MFTVARYFLITSILLLYACATTQSPDEGVVVDERAVSDQTNGISQTSAAITNLFEQSQAQVNSGNLDEGASFGAGIAYRTSQPRDLV